MRLPPRVHRRFIGACFTAGLVKEQADHISLRLLMEGSMLGLVLGTWLWGVFTLGAQAMVAQQSLPSDGDNLPGYVIRCCGTHSPKEEGARSVGRGDGDGCLLQEVRSSNMSTSRQPGAGLTDRQGHSGDH